MRALVFAVLSTYASAQTCNKNEYTLTMGDSYEDGWNGGTLNFDAELGGVSQGGITIGDPDTSDDDGITKTITLCGNGVLTNGVKGKYTSDRSFSVSPLNGAQIYSGDGTFWTDTANENGVVLCPSNTIWDSSACAACDPGTPKAVNNVCTACPGSAPKWDGTACIASGCAADETWQVPYYDDSGNLQDGTCPACDPGTPKAVNNVCTACPGSAPKWDGTACIASGCAADETWQVPYYDDSGNLQDGTCAACDPGTPKAVNNVCTACPGSAPKWDGTACIASGCVADGIWEVPYYNDNGAIQDGTCAACSSDFPVAFKNVCTVKPATFTTKIALQRAVDACIGISSVGNCCAPKDATDPAAAAIVAGHSANDGTCNDHTTHSHLQLWDVSQVTTMKFIFYNKPRFNQDLNAWNVSSATTMRYMFYNADLFNQDLNAWDVSSVKDMSSMFANARAFNGDISAWDVSSVTDMYGMFYDARAFDQILCGPSWVVNVDAAKSTHELDHIADTTCCPAGTYHLSPNTYCTDCAAGKYNVNTASTTQDDCKTCDSSTYSTAGAASCAYDAATCPAGTFAEGSASCAGCAAGKYNDQLGQDACKDCAAGKYNEQVGSTLESACKDCVVGKYNDQLGQDACTDCGAGKYNDQLGQDACTGCGAGKYNDEEGSLAESACKGCDAGKYNDQLSQGACTDCGAGKYNDQLGQDACTDCGAGKYNDAEGSLAESACTDCGVGRYNAEPGQSACQFCAGGKTIKAGVNTDAADCKSWDEIMADDQALLQALASRQDAC